MKFFPIILALIWTANFVLFLITKQPPHSFVIGGMYICLILANINDYMRYK